MSLRQFRPRGIRRGPSRPARIALYSLAGLTIGLQILYPLVHGDALRVITIATVYAAAGLMVTHAGLTFGTKYTAILVGITLPYAWLVEEIGSRSGWPFGSYHYDPSLGFHILGIPLVVPFAWLFMAHPLLIATRKISAHWTFAVGGFGAMAWDLFLDPQMVAAERWHWAPFEKAIPLIPTIPLANACGWLLSGMGLIALLHALTPTERKRNAANMVIVNFFLIWTWISGVLGNLFFFHRPGVAVMGGIFFGIFLASYLYSTSIGEPDEF